MNLQLRISLVITVFICLCLIGNDNAGGLYFSVRAASKAAHITQQLINIDLL